MRGEIGMRHCYMCERELWHRNGSHARRGKEVVEIEKMGKGRSNGGGEREGGREEEERERERERYTGRETQKKEEALVCAQVEDLKALGAFFAFGEGGKRLGKDASQGRRVL